MNAHPRAEIKLVDRVKEIRLLKEAASRAINSHGSVLLLHGEAGIGKTKLARDLGTYAQSNNMLVLSGRCPALFKMDGVPPYVLWKELIRDYLDVSTTEQLYRVTGFYPIEVSKLVPELGQKLKMIPESFPLNPEHSRDRFYEAVSRFIINISRESPLLIILDDLQWADQSSLLLLNYLARSIYKESLLVLGAYRDTFVDEQHSLFPVLTELNRERLAQSIQLKRLSFDHISEMIQRILEQDDIPREFCKLVYQRTRGNPFFVEEVINSLKEREIIDYRQGKWHIKSVSKISFPRTIKNLIKARTSRLDDDNQHVLTLASFIGKDFTFKALQGVSGIKEDKLLEILENLLKTGLLECKTVGRENVCSFADIIVRDVLHEAISPLRSKKLHHSVGLALEKVYAKDINEHLGELSLHFLESGDNEKALDYSLKAGEKAAEVYANSEAASHLQHAYVLLETKQDQLLQKATVLEKLGDVKSLTGEHDACVTYWNKALSLWKQLDEKMKASAIHRKLANLLWEEIGDTDKAKDHHSKALEILEAEPKSTELASLYEDIAHMLYITGNMSEALSLAEKSLKLAQKLNALEAIASSSASLGAIYASSREFNRAIEYFENALGIALENGYWETASRTYTWLSIIASAEKHLEYAEKGYELAKRVGSIENISWMQTRLAGIHIGSGNLKEAISLAEESVALDNKTGNLTNLSGSTGVLGFAYLILGDWAKSEQYCKDALNIAQKQPNFWLVAAAHQRLGIFYHFTGQYEQAVQSLEKANEIYAEAGEQSDQLWTFLLLIWAWIELRKVKRAENLLTGVREITSKSEDEELLAYTDVTEAILSRAKKDWEKSIEYFEKGLEKLGALNAGQWNVYWLARMFLCEYAKVYLERGEEADWEKAHNLITQALGIFQKMGARRDIDELKAKLAHLETRGEAQEIKTATAIPAITLPSHITTGYRELDNLLLGGIPRNHAVVLTASSCDEKDLLINKFLEAGTKQGEKTYHVTTKASGAKALAEACQSNFGLFLCNPQADKIIKNLPNVRKLKGVENLTDLNISLTTSFRRLGRQLLAPRRICLEIVSDVLLQHNIVQTRRWLNSLIPELKANGFTTLAVLDPQMHPPQDVSAIRDLFDGEISLYEQTSEKGLEKSLKIRKMYNQRYLESPLPLRKERLQNQKQ